MSHENRRRTLSAAAAVGVAGILAAACSSGGSSGGGGSNGSVVIKADLPPNTGSITSAENAGLKQLTAQYEAAHKNVTVQWLPVNTTSITQANATLESQASGGGAPDVVWEQYGPVTSGSIPSGLLQIWDVLEHGYWHARSVDYVGMPRSHLIEWLRLPGDLVFIVFGSVPLAIAAVEAWLGVRADAAESAG